MKGNVALTLFATMTAAVSHAAFNVTFSDYAADEALSQKGAVGGAWAELPSSAVNAPIGSVNAVGVNHDATGPLTFDFDEGVPANRTTCDFKAAFESCSDVTTLEAEADACRVTLDRRDDGSASFALAAGGSWHLLGGEGVEPKLDTLFEFRLETVSLAGGTYASLSVRGADGFVRLVDSYGAKWFALNTQKTAFSQIEFDGNGSVSDFSGADNGNAAIPAVAWTGGESGDWNDPANWSAAPASGDVVHVDGTAALTRGDEAATVRGLVGRIGEDGNLELLAGEYDTEMSLDCSRPRVGKKLTVKAGTFAGLGTPFESVAWYRGTPYKSYSSTAIATTSDYYPTESDLESWLRVVARRKGEVAFEKEFYFSSLPVLYLTTNDGSTPTAAKESHKGWLTVQGGAEFKAGYDGKMEIKVRGNSTAGLDKKPWKLKLDGKAEMCGIPKSKHWVLLANYWDESSLRNKLAYDFANGIGSLGMKSDWVECVLNGSWQGLYQLCEHIRIAKDRVNIFNWEDEADDRGIEGGDEDLSWVGEDDDITGGYLFESSEEMDELSRFAIRPRDDFIFNVMINSPEYLYTNERMMDWCKSYLGKFYESMVSVDGYSSEGLHYSQYADVDSMAAYFLVMEMFGNDDAEKKSRYFYKDRGGLVKFGPVWDFDWGVGNNMVSSNPNGWRAQNHKCSFFRQWADDPWFCTRLKEIYWKTARARFAEMLGENGLIASYKAKLLVAGTANDGKWRHTRGFDADVDRLHDFLSRRLEWLDLQFADVRTLMASLKTSSAAPYEPAVAELPISFINLRPTGHLKARTDLVMSVTFGGTPASVGVFVNGLKLGEPMDASSGRLETTIPAEALTAAPGESNCVSLIAYDSSGNPIARNYALVTADAFQPTAIILR